MIQYSSLDLLTGALAEEKGCLKESLFFMDQKG